MSQVMSEIEKVGQYKTWKEHWNKIILVNMFDMGILTPKRTFYQKFNKSMKWKEGKIERFQVKRKRKTSK